MENIKAVTKSGDYLPMKCDMCGTLFLQKLNGHLYGSFTNNPRCPKCGENNLLLIHKIAMWRFKLLAFIRTVTHGGDVLTLETEKEVQRNGRNDQEN